MDTLSITPIPAFADNYIWLLARDGAAVVVDPGDARPVRSALAAQQLELTGILITHHHMDHIGGLPALRAAYDVPVYGPRAESGSIPGLSHQLDDGDRITLEALQLELGVMAVPGHTLGHIAYHTPGLVLCGDTLFSAGCGRLFEGTPGQMYDSLSKLAALPEDTAVYCTHEYTLANLAFAAEVDPDNDAVRAEIRRARDQRRRGSPTLPSSIGLERCINPFLRCHEPAVVRAAERRAGNTLPSAPQVFATLRHWKDGFRAPDMN